MKIELSERAREARKEYMRRWREANREKARRAEAEKWERVADQYEAEAKAGGRPFPAQKAN